LDCFATGIDLELLVDISEMGFDGGDAQAELEGQILVGTAVGKGAENSFLPEGELAETSPFSANWRKASATFRATELLMGEPP
jgi:hypothetical protein